MDFEGNIYMTLLWRKSKVGVLGEWWELYVFCVVTLWACKYISFIFIWIYFSFSLKHYSKYILLNLIECGHHKKLQFNYFLGLSSEKTGLHLAKDT